MRKGRRMGSGTGSLVHSPFVGVHNDADGTTADVPGMLSLLGRCGVLDNNANGALLVYRAHGFNVQAGAVKGRPFLIAGKAAGYTPVAFLTPFDDAPGDASQTAAALAYVDTCIAAYRDINPVFLFYNHNSDTWSGTDAEFFTLEALTIKKVQDAGLRWGATDDKGISWLAQNVVERRAAWAAAGVTSNNCAAFCEHAYVNAGFVPTHALLAIDSLARVGVTTPIWLTELAWDFVHSNATPPADTREGRPDLFLRPATDWTRWLFKWCRAKGIKMAFFDGPMLLELNNTTLSTLGVLYTEDLGQGPGYVEPLPVNVPPYLNDEARIRAYAIRLSNGGTVAEATAAANRVFRGIVFER